MKTPTEKGGYLQGGCLFGASSTHEGDACTCDQEHSSCTNLQPQRDVGPCFQEEVQDAGRYNYCRQIEGEGFHDPTFFLCLQFSNIPTE